MSYLTYSKQPHRPPKQILACHTYQTLKHQHYIYIYRPHRIHKQTLRDTSSQGFFKRLRCCHRKMNVVYKNSRLSNIKQIGHDKTSVNMHCTTIQNHAISECDLHAERGHTFFPNWGCCRTSPFSPLQGWQVRPQLAPWDLNPDTAKRS